MSKYLVFGLFGWLVASIANFSALAQGDTTEFRFIGGDVANGKEAFQRLNCIQCHIVENVAFEKEPEIRRLSLPLAKEVRFVKGYRDLLTAITNPQHVVSKQYAAMLAGTEKIGEIEAFMPKLTEDMSAQQLIDIVAFLDTIYRTELLEYKK